MINKAAIYCANKAIQYGTCDKSEFEVYQYGFSILFNKLILYPIILIIGLITNCVPQLLIFHIFLIKLRGEAGGYHMQTRMGCTIMSCFIWGGAGLISKHMDYAYFILLVPLLGASIIYILLNAPFNHVNINFTDYEIKRQRTRTRWILAIEIVLILLFQIFSSTIRFVIPASLAITTVAITILIGKIFKQEVK